MITQPILFHDRGCPFAHRVAALVDHLGIAVERREAPVGVKPAGLEAHSPSGAIPLLVDGELILTESRVMLEHLAEAHSFGDAYPANLVSRTQHRHAMAVTDEHLVPALMGTRKRRNLDALDAIERAVDAEPYPCLLTFHVAPIWLRFRLWQPDGEMTREIMTRTRLRTWLDRALALPAIARTSPDPKTHAEDLVRAREAGLMPG